MTHMPKAIYQDPGIVLLFIRRGQGWSQVQLGKAAHTSPNLINDYEQGRKELSRKRLEFLISFMGVPPEVIDENLARLEANRAAAGAPGSAAGLTPARRRIEAVVSRVGRLATEFARVGLSIVALEGEALQAREEARRLWPRLEHRKADERLALVEEFVGLRTWAMVELVSAKSIERAPSSPAEALELAELALRIAELCLGNEWLRQRAQGYAWFHVANARRVTNDLPRADMALSKAKPLWKAGAPGDPGLFDETWGYWIEATVRKAQRRFPEARRRIEQALAADRGSLRGKLLLSKAQILGVLGDFEGSTEVLGEALPYIDEEREPRTALGVRCEFLRNLTFQDRAAEAAPRLREVQALAEQLGQEVDLIHVSFIRGKIAAGTGRAEEAEEIFEEARRKFASLKPPLVLEYALVSLDLGLLLLEQDRTAEVRILSEQMTWIFSSQGIRREALAALRIFCEAAKRKAATVDLARRVIRFLHRSQHDPELKFETTEEAEAP
jgi:tetratricopeptide (TPR) repeat protein